MIYSRAKDKCVIHPLGPRSPMLSPTLPDLLSAVRARACAVRSRVSNAVSYLGMYAERGL